MNYHPPGIYVWDSWYLQRGGRTHCFFLQQLRPGATPAGILDGEFAGERGSIGHAVSDDLVEWTTLPTALYRGPEGGYDDYDLWTGSCIERDGTVYLFYTARSSREKGTVNRIAVATSEDGLEWTRHEENPIVTPDPRWYHGESNPRIHGRQLWPTVDCRDLCVVADPDGDGYWGFFAARRPAPEIARTAVIGLCHSNDLIHWEQRPPCFVPDRYACVEVPDVFQLDGRWYMICLTGNGYGQRNRVSERNLSGLVSIYAVSDRPDGPYREMDGNVLLGAEANQGFTARTVEVDGERYLFYTQAEVLSGSNLGTISLPKVLRTDAEGHLLACWSDRIERYFRQPLVDGNDLTVVEDNGFWGSRGRWEQRGHTVSGSCEHDWAVQVIESRGENFLYSADVLLDDARGAGLIFRAGGNTIYDGGYAVILDASLGQVVFTKLVEFPRIESREWKLTCGTVYNLKVTAIDAIINIFIDDVLALQLHHPAYASGRFGLFVEQGRAEFSNITAIRVG